MESGIQSSFIPQDAAKEQYTARSYEGGGLSDLLTLGTVVVFVASAALAGAVFLYAQYLNQQAASKLQQLKVAEQAFQPSLVQELIRLDDRMRTGEQVLLSHVAPTVLFQALQQTTLETIGFSSLDFSATDPQVMSVKMSGVAKDVNSIALEADILSKSGVITNPIFSGIDREKDGVHFQLNASVNPSSLNYVQLINTLLQGQQGQTGQAQQQQPAQGSQQGAVQPAAQTQTQPQQQTPAHAQPAQGSLPQQQPGNQPAQQSGSPFGN